MKGDRAALAALGPTSAAVTTAPPPSLIKLRRFGFEFLGEFFAFIFSAGLSQIARFMSQAPTAELSVGLPTTKIMMRGARTIDAVY